MASCILFIVLGPTNVTSSSLLLGLYLCVIYGFGFFCRKLICTQSKKKIFPLALHSNCTVVEMIMSMLLLHSSLLSSHIVIKGQGSQLVGSLIGKGFLLVSMKIFNPKQYLAAS